MKAIRKQAVGVDVSKADFVARLIWVEAESGQLKSRRRRRFVNTLTGFQAFHEWLKKHTLTDVPLVIMMEATGVYHEELAYYLDGLHYAVSIQLPNKVKAYAHSLNTYSKTDPIDADIIARMAAERQVDRWRPMSRDMLTIKALSRQRAQLIAQRTRVSNQRHAHSHGVVKSAQILDRYETLLTTYDDMIAQTEREMKQLAKANTSLSAAVAHLSSIHGIGLVTALTVLAETDGFRLFTSRSQVVRYAGYDVEQRQSGSSLQGRGRISKRGNSHIRRALYMPSLSAVSKPGIFKDLYERVVERTGRKQMALVAVQRKLLTTMYALQKNGTYYEVEYHKTHPKNGVGKPDDLPTVTTP
jgi:transposase